MLLAGHLPTMRFDRDALLAMPFRPRTDDGLMWPHGYHRTTDNRGKPIVVYCAVWNTGDVSFAVRPVVRVKMGRRVAWPIGPGIPIGLMC